MADSTHERRTGTSAAYGETSETPLATGWVGWVGFAGVMMIIAGSLNAFYGVVAVVNDDWDGWTTRAGALLDIDQWGWAHIVVGLVVALAGIGVLAGNLPARILGVIIVALSLITNFFFIPVNPVWSIIVMVIDVLVIWALMVHGREMRYR